MEFVRDFVTSHLVLVTTFLLGLLATVMKNVMYRQISRKRLKWSQYFWVTVGTVADSLPVLVWSSLFLQLIGWNLIASIAVQPFLLVLNWLYTQVSFLIRWNTARVYLGAAIAVEGLILYPLPFDYDVIPAALPQMSAVIALLILIFLFCMSIIIRFFPEKKVDLEQIVRDLNYADVGWFKLLRFKVEELRIRLKAFLYKSLSKFFYAGGAVLEGLSLLTLLTVARIILWPFRQIKRLSLRRHSARA